MSKLVGPLASRTRRKNVKYSAIPGRREHHAIFLAVLVELEQQQRLVTTKELRARLGDYLVVSSTFDRVLRALEQEDLLTLSRPPHDKHSWWAISSTRGKRLATEVNLSAVKDRHHSAR